MQKNHYRSGVPLSFIPVLTILILFAIACVNMKNRGAQTSTPANTTPPETNSNQNPTIAKPANFAPKNICTLPQQTAANTAFAALGGGTWGKWHDSGGNLDYGCNGGKDTITLKDDGKVNITAEYGAIGEENAVHYISAEYMAMQYTGQTSGEKQLRQQYADFCDKLSLKLYSVKMPEKFRKRLLDESTYSASGTANEYSEKVGNGYVNLSSNKNGTTMILLDVHFFSSEAEFINSPYAQTMFNLKFAK